MNYEVTWSGSLERQGVAPSLSGYQGRSPLALAIAEPESVKDIQPDRRPLRTRAEQLAEFKRSYFKPAMDEKKAAARHQQKRQQWAANAKTYKAAARARMAESRAQQSLFEASA